MQKHNTYRLTATGNVWNVAWRLYLQESQRVTPVVTDVLEAVPARAASEEVLATVLSVTERRLTGVILVLYGGAVTACPFFPASSACSVAA